MIVGEKDLGPSVDQHAIPGLLDTVRSEMRNRRDTTYVGRMMYITGYLMSVWVRVEFIMVTPILSSLGQEGRRPWAEEQAHSDRCASQTRPRHQPSFQGGLRVESAQRRERPGVGIYL
jgi:hypothetical protein